MAPARRLRGRVRVPGDKSISHRAAIIAALARGRTEIRNFSTSADCASTLALLRALGVRVERDGAVVRVEGAGMREGPPDFSAPSSPLDCGNSGTTMRLFVGVLAAQAFACVLTGDESLSRRPMRRVIEPLELMGARLTALDGHAPLRVEGRRPLKAVEYESPVASAQVKSCVLLAGLGADGRTSVVERGALTRDHTERMLGWFGAEVETTTDANGDGGIAANGEGMNVESGDGVGIHTSSVRGPARLEARDLEVPGDISSAAFLLAAAALLPGSDVTIEGVGLNPTRAEIVSTLQSLGADVRVADSREVCREPVGDLRARGAGGLAPSNEAEGRMRVGGSVLRGADVSRLIDELPVLAVVGSQTEGGLEIRDARELRVKESDRISATVENLRAMGAEVEEFDDGLRVRGPARLCGARLRSFGDHRIAMAFAVAGLTAEGETFIEGAEECVAISFPEFFPLLESLAER
ncbi:MAG: 3-phosphoshikimate 1-carboxyvinyltransferase [Acidobacteriota bacterium]|nr:3-phosphoshikimate 1-carboxyvinyltransferase [Acidobacteriota bacterium]